MGKNFTKDKSEALYNKFRDWRDKLLDLQNSIIIIEGKRDLAVLKQLGVQEISNTVIMYSQKSFIEVEEFLHEEENKDKQVIPLVDFDRQGEEYLKEIESMTNKVDLELRFDLRNMTRGKLQEFEDLLYLLKSKLHPNYWLVLCQTLNLTL